MSELVLLEKKQHYAIITMNRPDAMNALSNALRTQMRQAFQSCTDDADIRVIILTGAGRAFCAGMDLMELASGNGETAADADVNALADTIAGFKGPVIAAVNGHAVTAGFELALACDVIIASKKARFADTHARVGILPGWGLSQRLPRLIGLSRAKELSFTGQPIYGEQAVAWGLANHVTEPENLLSKAEELAEHMCACVPHILQQYKVLIDTGYNMHLNEALAWENREAIISAEKATGDLIASRRAAVFDKGRSD